MIRWSGVWLGLLRLLMGLWVLLAVLFGFELRLIFWFMVWVWCGSLAIVCGLDACCVLRLV